MNARLRHIAAAGLLLLTGLIAPGLAIEPKDLVGQYLAKGTNPDGKSKYEGTADITLEPDNTLTVSYRFGKVRDVGSATVKGDTLTVRFKAGNPKSGRTGEAQYELQPNGDLKGWWHYKGTKKMPEILIPTKKK